MYKINFKKSFFPSFIKYKLKYEDIFRTVLLTASDMMEVILSLTNTTEVLMVDTVEHEFLSSFQLNRDSETLLINLARLGKPKKDPKSY